jgi:hypothetical protein
MRQQLCALLILLAASHTLPVALSSRDGSTTSAKHLTGFHIEQFGRLNALGEMSEKADIVIGLDAIQPKEESTIAFDFAGGTVADLLNTFVSVSQDYAWSETNSGVVHVQRSGAHVTLLDVVLNYPGAVKKTRHDIWQDIAKRPEVIEWMQSNHCTREEFFTGGEFQSHNDPISVEAGSLTVSDLLDDIASKSGTKYWAVLQSPASTPCSVSIILW